MSKLLIERTGHDIRVEYKGNNDAEIIRMIYKSAKDDQKLRSIFMTASKFIKDFDDRQNKTTTQ